MIPIDVGVLIVGGGPAGSTLAGLLADRGREVVVVDRATFPRAKPCGESVNPGAVAALRRLGLYDRLRLLNPAPIRGWSLRGDGRSESRGAYPEGAVGYGVARQAFDHALLHAARDRGARVCEGMRVEGIATDDHGRWRIHTRAVDGTIAEWRPRLLVGADGLRSRVASRLGLVRRPPRIRKLSLTYRLRGSGPDRRHGALYHGPQFTVGLAPVHDSLALWNATVVLRGRPVGGVTPATTRGVFRRAMAVASFPWRDGHPEVVDGPWASGPFDRPMVRAVRDGAVLVGDAAGYFDPLTGQGIYHALRSAELSAPVLADALARGQTDATRLRSYHDAMVREIRPVRWFQHGVEMVVSHTASRRTALWGLHTLPALVDRVIRVAGDIAPVRSLVYAPVQVTHRAPGGA